MANNKKPLTRANGRKPSAKKTTPKKRTTAAKKTTKRVSVKNANDAGATTVRYTTENGEDAKTFTWAGKVWSSAAQAGDPAAKAFRDFFHKTIEAGKEVRLPEDVARRIFESAGFRWYSNRSTSPEKQKQTTTKASKPSAKNSSKTKSDKTTVAKKSDTKVAKKSGKTKPGAKRPPRKG